VLETVSFATRPEAITEQTCDCLWIVLSSRKRPEPTQNVLVEWVDWKLLGKISQYLASGGTKQSTFLPTVTEGFSPRMVVLDRLDYIEWDKVRRNLEGMRVKRLMILFEDWEEAKKHQTELETHLGDCLDQFELATERDPVLEQ